MLYAERFQQGATARFQTEVLKENPSPPNFIPPGGFFLKWAFPRPTILCGLPRQAPLKNFFSYFLFSLLIGWCFAREGGESGCCEINLPNCSFSLVLRRRPFRPLGINSFSGWGKGPLGQGKGVFSLLFQPLNQLATTETAVKLALRSQPFNRFS